MLTLISMFFILSLISMMMLSINFLISKKSLMDREKISPFECGFDPLSNSRIPFSIQFFMISLIFLIFDIEITLLIPLIYLFTYMNMTVIFTTFLFLIILIIGLYLEYLEESMDWKL
ncbi:NADH dehydrogenase subunit 3 (mitochondrion) [Linepithema humile]|uniref:NADH-ubiquinone oxidoreductase chain 3 n=1 Tax=Linepithema humile TaxID=83485 RepID=A0A0S2A3I3_LINHU|nr:NADH dehydrogenase subunit 3 [Linepithema humile]ALN11729.1 NADH dehydrogenase subunit 3 [Linepithema humile]ANI87492.1 NADH dehydrogenase subunit 3 [Linepithema humile]QNV47342.1 NADH dehydrogenase subunit 3 [Linepithema humile]